MLDEYDMDKNKFTPIIELEVGNAYDIIGVIDTVEIRNTKAGKPFMTLQIVDSTGRISARIWDGVEDIKDSVVKGKAIEATATIKEYNKEKEAHLSSNSILVKNISDYPPETFVAKSPRNIEEMEKELFEYINSIKNSDLKAILEKVFSEDFLKTFLAAPAAKGYHQNYVGGLIEHTLNVTKSCDTVCSIYKDLDRDLTITGALIHDVGKTWGYKYDPMIDVTIEEGVLGHIFSGASYIRKLIEGMNINKETEYKLLHIILSHHSKAEWGAIMEPMFPEALLVASMDMLDSELFGFVRNYNNAREATEEEFYYDKYNKKRYFIGVRNNTGSNE